MRVLPTPQQWRAALNTRLFITDTRVIDEFRIGFDTREGLRQRIPWLVWAKPLGLWMIFIAAVYMMFYSVSSLVYDSWARREKLVFPLARLPEDLMHAEGSPPGSLPAMFRKPLFWIGFGIVFLLLSYNGACRAGWIPGMVPLKQGLDVALLRKMLQNTIFKGIADAGSSSLILFVTFTTVGIGFLLPLDISRSLWMYYLAALAMLMVAIWCAVAASCTAFRSDFTMDNSFITSLGAGALLTFSATCLGKLVKDRWATTREQMPGRRGLPLAGCFIQNLGYAGLFFLISVVTALSWFAWSRIDIFWGMAFLGVVILVTVGLMRVVAEGGVHWFQIHTGPFHLARLVGGVKVVPAAVIAPLMAIYSVLFLDIKTFMAPAVLNSYKMQDETRASRRMFHLIVIVCIVVTIVVACVGMLYLTYEIGANRGSSWFWTTGPQSVMDRTQRIVSDSLGKTGQYNWIFYLIGAGWVALSIFMRRRFFWWLHPIGLVMLANPLMRALWFSFFLGWLCKKITVKYGGRHMFARMRPLFIGLILGEVLAVFLWMLLSQWLGIGGVLTLNRSVP